MKKQIVLIIAAALTFSVAAAGDLGMIKIKNDYQAQVAQTILEGAYTRVEQGYLVLISPDQAAILNQAGIEFRIVMPDVDPSLTYLIYAPEKPGAAKAPVAGAVEIGMGLQVVQADEAQSRHPGVHFGPRAVPLSGLSVKIRYIPKAVYDFFAMLEDYPTDSIADLVSQDSAYAYLTRLEAFETRYVWTDSVDRARDWIVQKFMDFGYTDVTTPEFDFGGGWHYNVMAVKPGWAEPDKVIVIGGHYDSIVEDHLNEPGSLYFAPGADDNASGAALVMELARVMADVSFRKTVIFMTFSAEEIGLWGSYSAADSFVANGTDVEAMLNFDMVAYDPDYLSKVQLQSGEITGYQDVMAAAATRVTSVTPEIVPMAPSSDHYSFYTRGFPIAKANEYAWYPYWHSNDDTSDKLNFPYFTEVIKMTAAAVGVIANS
ncbi:MAG: M20/M25/M40 family metallo-hydrolase, partial [Candidatus Zixiibacteriota bacterium]